MSIPELFHKSEHHKVDIHNRDDYYHAGDHETLAKEVDKHPESLVKSPSRMLARVISHLPRLISPNTGSPESINGGLYQAGDHRWKHPRSH